MDVGRTFDKGARAGKTVVTRVCDALSRMSAFLAAVMGFLARFSERMSVRFRAANGRFERGARWLNAKATGVPLGVDVAGDEWEEPAILPVAEPPPIPPAAFFTVSAPAQDEEWNAAISAAKQATPAPEPTQENWEAALLAAKRVHETPAAKPAAAAKQSPSSPRPSASRMTELRVGPRASAARAVQPHITLKESAVPAGGSTDKPRPSADPQVAATRKAVAAALRS
jgi:hypothetical protein